ncbi:unnamed protein product [Schistosoma turkestanicum]|nr:unnamed protein product [Schistosoma turkestanicum]
MSSNKVTSTLYTVTTRKTYRGINPEVDSASKIPISCERAAKNPKRSVDSTPLSVHTLDHSTQTPQRRQDTTPIPKKTSKSVKNRRKRRPKARSTLKQHKDDCFACSSPVKTSDHAFECNFCSTWVHCHCDNTVPKEYYGFMLSHPCPWFWYVCPRCRVSEALTKPQVSPKTSPQVQTTKAKSPGTKPVKQVTKATTTLPNTPTKPPVVVVPPVATSNRQQSVTVKKGKGNTPTHKQPPPKTRDNRSNSLILFNVPVSEGSLLEGRAAFDKEQWDKFCSTLGMCEVPAKICRLFKGQNVSKGKPPPMRVTLDSARLAEDIILSSQRPSVKLSSLIRIRHDKPWSVRAAARTAPDTQEQTTMVVHGIPELTNGNPDEAHEHDVQQWRWLSRSLSLHTPMAVSISRLPRPSHLTSIKSPRLIAVTLRNREDLTETLQAWYSSKNDLPSHIRCCESRPRSVRQQQGGQNERTQLIVKLGQLPLAQDVSEPTAQAKNLQRPVPTELADSV